MKLKKREVQEINTGSMADIAFLLLIFFLVSTTILQEKGVSLKLPPEPEDQEIAEIHDRNLYKILVNSSNQYLIEDQRRDNLTGLREEVKAFVMNNSIDPALSVSPDKATISIKTSRGTDYKYFIAVLDEVKEAYYEIYGARVGMSSEDYRALDLDKPTERDLISRGKDGIPMNISIAQPEKTL
ncbi:ExbD/TolR family protein [Marinoscillum pacificum]|uniref:ExbD/TolR family protein n=1 Tax=Marinoscillum pacificum TaxID=392723 RepID=UPI00215781C2|nr:biopolymer transporter ExbD [Marinoscillum pacificum]